MVLNFRQNFAVPKKKEEGIASLFSFLSSPGPDRPTVYFKSGRPGSGSAA
jgi:hypothetical protein